MSKVSEKNHQEPNTLFHSPNKHIPEKLHAEITKTGRIGLKNIKDHIPAHLTLVEQILTNPKTLVCLTNICLDSLKYELLYDGPKISFCYHDQDVNRAFVCNHLGYNSQIHTPTRISPLFTSFPRYLPNTSLTKRSWDLSNGPSIITRTSLLQNTMSFGY